VSNEGGGISVISAKDDQLLAMRKVGRGPRAMAFTPDGKTMLVGVIDDDSIAFMNAASGEIENTIGGVGNSPQRVVVASNGQSAVVVSRITHSLHLVDLTEGRRRALRRLQVGPFPMGLELSDPPNYAYVAVSGDNNLAIVDLRTLDIVRLIPTGKTPLTVAVRR
jgi:DNA-binding beta-propeller fold protein YncE